MSRDKPTPPQGKANAPREFWIEQFNGRKPPSFYAFKDKPSFNKLMLKIDDAEVKACEGFSYVYGCPGHPAPQKGHGSDE